MIHKLRACIIRKSFTDNSKNRSRWMQFHVLSAGCLMILTSYLHADDISPPPEDVKWVDVKALGAKGDGITDDTPVLKAYTPSSPHSAGTIYFPNGTYLLSDTIVFGNKRLVIQGESMKGVILKLKANSPGFENAEKPKPFISTYEKFMDPKAGWGQAFKNSVRNLTIEIEAGNPGAVALHYLANNQGSVEDVTLKGAGKAGLGLLTNWPGPSLIRNLRIEGFDMGVWSLIAQYSMTFENLTLINQNQFGIYNRNQALFIRNLKSENRVPVLRNTTPTTNIVIVDSTLDGGDSSGTAIDSTEEKKSDRYGFKELSPGIYLRNVTISGYGQGLSFNRKGETITVPAGKIDEFSSIPAVKLNSTAEKMLNLPVEDAPPMNLGPSSSWVNATKFEPESVTIKNKVHQDWSPALQAAIDSGAEVVYFPRGEYRLFKTVILRGKIKALLGMDGTLSTSDWNLGGEPVFKIIDNGQPAILFDRINDNYGKAPVIFSLEAAKTVIMRNGQMKHFRNTVPGGRLFIYDVCGDNFEFNGLDVWARQFNAEAGGGKFNIRIKGGSLWILGYKTEYGQTAIEASDGARVEVLGGWHYHNGKIGYLNQDSQMSIAGLMTISGWFSEALIREIRGGTTKDLLVPLGKSDKDAFNGAYRQYGTIVPLYLGN